MVIEGRAGDGRKKKLKGETWGMESYRSLTKERRARAVLCSYVYKKLLARAGLAPLLGEVAGTSKRCWMPFTLTM